VKGNIRRLSLALFQLTILFSSVALCAADHIRYVVSLANPEKHLVRVTIEIPPGESERELQLPVWNALYQVRDFSQYMNWIRAETSTGTPVPLQQINTSRWKISGAARGASIQYEMFSDGPGPYGAELNTHHAFFNLAEILCYVEDERARPSDIEFRDLPPHWNVATALKQQGSTFSADNYDQLVDSPVEIGTFQERDVEAPFGKYRIVVDADDQAPILDKITPAVLRIAGTEVAWMNDRPFQAYLFIFHFFDAPGDGGMEHACSTAITLPKRDLSDDFERFTNVTAHEFFHLWNVKRIRPQSLEPIDYTQAN
jgi:predicted metalloprotease with PDZ domain